MEAVLYEDLPDSSARLARLRAALQSFVCVREAAPVAVALLVPVAPAPGARAACAATARLRRACADRAALRRWLRRGPAGSAAALDLWVAAAAAPRDAAELSALAQWQSDRGGSPLRGADALCLSLRGGAALWADGPPPRLAGLVLAHQCLLLDLTCCVGAQRPVDPAAIAPIGAAARVAKGRTAAVIFYGAWLRATGSARGLAQLQQQLRAVARHVIAPAQLPLCCAHGGSVESLQGKQGDTDEIANEGESTVGAEALLATRAVQDVHCLVAVLLGHPQVDYHAEALAFCAAVRRRRRTAGMIAELCPTQPVAAKQKGIYKRPREENAAPSAETQTVSGAAEEPLWCEDLGS